MLLSVMRDEASLAEAAKAGADTVVLEQILQTLSTWPVLRNGNTSSPAGAQPMNLSEQASAVQSGPIPVEIAPSLPFVAAAHLLSTMAYNYRRIAHGDSHDQLLVEYSRATQIACFALSSCRHAPLQKLPKPVEEDAHKEDYHMMFFQFAEKKSLDWLQQNCNPFEIHASSAIAYQNSIADITTDAAALQLGRELQQCQKLAEDWFDSTQNDACKSLVMFLVRCLTTSNQSTPAAWDASARQVSRQLCKNSTPLPGHMTQLMTQLMTKCCSGCHALRNSCTQTHQSKRLWCFTHHCHMHKI